MQFTPEQQRASRQYKNVMKHVRLAKATQGSESATHMSKASKLSARYIELSKK